MKFKPFILLLTILCFSSSVFSQGNIYSVVNGWGFSFAYSDSLDSTNTYTYLNDISGQNFRLSGKTFHIPGFQVLDVGFKKIFNISIPDTIAMELSFVEGLNLSSLWVYLYIKDSTGSWCTLPGSDSKISLNHEWQTIYFNIDYCLSPSFIQQIGLFFQIEGNDSLNSIYVSAELALRKMLSVDSLGVHVIDSFSDPNGVKVTIQDLTDFILEQNYPNPFNPSTTISYQLPAIGFITLKVYDILGREVATLVNEEKPAGSYEIELNGLNLSTGIYFYQLQAGDYIETRKMVLLR